MASLQNIVAWVTKNPNRVVLYLTVLGTVLSAGAAVATDLDATQVAVVLGAIASVDAKVITWLRGWQKAETAVYQQRHIAAQADAVDRAQQAEAALAAQVAAPRPRGAVLPR